MSARYEGAGAKDVKITILKAGEEIGQDVVPEGEIALCFNYDEVFYIQGTLPDLFFVLDRARWELNRIEKEGPDHEDPDSQEYERLRRTDSNDLTGES